MPTPVFAHSELRALSQTSLPSALHLSARFPEKAKPPLQSGLVLFSTLLVFLSLLTSRPANAAQPKRLLLIGQGSDGHPPATHEFMAGVRIIQQLLSANKEVRATLTKRDEPWPKGPGLIDQADGIVMFVTQGARWIQNDPKRHDALKRLIQRKGGLVALHWAVGATNAKYIDGQLELLGGTRGGPQRKYKVLETDLTIVDPTHPITAGIPNFRINDEFYYRLDFVKSPNRMHPLITGRIDDNDETVCWAWERPDGGRSFGFVGLHFHKNWERPEYRRLVTQGILWTLFLPIAKDGVQVDIDPEALELNAPTP